MGHVELAGDADYEAKRVSAPQECHHVTISRWQRGAIRHILTTKAHLKYYRVQSIKPAHSAYVAVILTEIKEGRAF
jgi:hypothetical protein